MRMFKIVTAIVFFSLQGERTFSEEEEEKLQAALTLDKHALDLVLETTAFILEQVGGGHPEKIDQSLIEFLLKV